ncbi:sensor histidine kinase [Pedobacter cryoconitis]|uniref:Signal transduction histidine kinase internal region domain-containing protein n=1 Tax=Pedobacter cryoconitis TaxID=188932 RepID=A0A7X0MHE0_9SPHI|nr:sensor histidine kinase [Pedobacter cryoconitis]MBB6499039.1 hypothetical protein [Pedobacter cryoconitis]
MTRARLSAAIIHIAAWLLFMCFPIIFMNQENNFMNSFMEINPWSYIKFSLLYVIIFYLNNYYLFPKLYFHKKYLLYFLSIIALLIIVFMIKPFDQLMALSRHEGPPPISRPHLQKERERPPFPKPDNRHKGFRFDINSLFIFLMVVGIGIALRTIKEWQLTEKRAILAEAEKANAELSFLKAQINPHFLYNTLNNIYTLCITNNERAAESIMKLSHIMRYITDEAETNFVPLQGEIDCINNFIDLQKIRLGKKVNLIYEVTGNPKGHQISPLILMTFIENVFKYGLSNHTETTIEIKIQIEAERIYFFTQNTILEMTNLNERKGLGISNTKQRLEHLYPEKHELKIDDQNKIFTVSLLLIS